MPKDTQSNSHQKNDNFRIDAHKLMFHPGAVSAVLRRDLSKPPVYVEISPTPFCNHACEFCGLDFARGKGKAMDAGRAVRLIKELGSIGVKSIMYGGEGEPFAHPEFESFLLAGAWSHVAQAITTNGALMRAEGMRRAVSCCEWIKVSINAGCGKDYARVHGVKEREWDGVVENIRAAVEYRNSIHARCKIGIQCVVYESNVDNSIRLTEVLESSGADYLVFKPLSVHPRQMNSCKPLSSPRLREWIGSVGARELPPGVIVRENAFTRTGNQGHGMCQSVPFLWAYIAANGDVWACSAMIGDSRFNIGNIRTLDFSDVWKGEKRAVLAKHMTLIDTKDCRENCRMSECNAYLDKVALKSEHWEFI
jgi:cyclic pyranopterin phosphate synthase